MNLIEPRGHGKTTAILEFILWSSCYAVYSSVAYIASEKLGKEGIGKIRKELEMNDSLRFVFGDLVPANSDDMRDKRLRRWKNTEIELLNGVYVGTMTKGQPFR